MKNIAFFLCLFPLMAPVCKKEGRNCHHNILFKNSAGHKIVFAYKYGSADTCMLDGWQVAPGEQFNLDHRFCWENKLKDGGVLEFYIADPSTYVNQLKVDCDSIGQQYPVLKHYQLSLNEIREMNWQINYE